MSLLLPDQMYEESNSSNHKRQQLKKASHNMKNFKISPLSSSSSSLEELEYNNSSRKYEKEMGRILKRIQNMSSPSLDLKSKKKPSTSVHDRCKKLNTSVSGLESVVNCSNKNRRGRLRSSSHPRSSDEGNRKKCSLVGRQLKRNSKGRI
ncbi:unnamed protein product [Lepeophtheirus salmonis]|uniref:(salmon louse) hypothetical protein n=1 Tax=Lepeophtheirus salmonis TaxID=72036 RepID=A0A7R8H051_LEPSM|nr:unnamed protein product [Lepeophtheirus salmonis]CAF2762739.1 unnamed protein product [Lepeophtheirus salmonis]